MPITLERLLADGRDRWRRLDELLDIAAKSPAWELGPETLVLRWAEAGGPPPPQQPIRRGFGTKVIAAGSIKP